MHAYPHTQLASASGTPTGVAPLACPSTPAISTAAPPRFDGPGGCWSPESRLIRALADRSILAFRAIGLAARPERSPLDCSIQGVLANVDRVTRYSHFSTRATPSVPAGTDAAKARQRLERGEQTIAVRVITASGRWSS
ncbi:MAG: OsmC family peroxiredoxin [Proteobacteria bacterium]|nr:OsmC family peroxiredoxin [Pseudomonadota bacterium]